MNFQILVMYFFITFQIDAFELVKDEYTTCSRLGSEKCYGSNNCKSNTQNKIKPDSLSKMTCFHSSEQLNFTMGTNKPVFESDGESPARTVHLDPFCMDQTAVSNLQFIQFVQETNYKTEVK